MFLSFKTVFYGHNEKVTLAFLAFEKTRDLNTS